MQKELPRYRCHKEVWAVKIRSIDFDDSQVTSGGRRKFMIVPEDTGYSPFEVPFAYVHKHSPRAGGYYVIYNDGYQSFSPAQAFEEGYARI